MIAQWQHYRVGMFGLGQDRNCLRIAQYIILVQTIVCVRACVCVCEFVSVAPVTLIVSHLTGAFTHTHTDTHTHSVVLINVTDNPPADH